jgi:hypothetical protein
MHRSWYVGSVLVGALPLAAVGCGGGGPKTYAVEGKVVYRSGVPLQRGTVELESLGADAARVNSRAAIQPDGTFRVSGVAGPHRAIVMPLLPSATELRSQGRPKPVLHRRFQDYETSGLQFVVTPERTPLALVVDGP